MLPLASVAPDGALYVTTVAPVAGDPRVGGVAVTNEGSVCIDAGIPQVFANGFGLQDDGSLCVNQTGVAVSNYNQGLPVDAQGQLVCRLNQPILPSDAFVGGIRVGPLGGVYITNTAPPPPFSFSNGFSNGFNIL